LARDGDRRALARIITRIESGGRDAGALVAALYPHTGEGYTIGLTGAPGAGKSTLTDQLITKVRSDGNKVAVLAIDPSSPFSGGAILGDRVRMQGHALDEGVYIRSMASRGHLGGLALAAPQAVRVMDAAGYPWILLETVGVGQVEVEVAGAADTTVVVVNPGWGDSVQANKAGLLEIGDIFVVNKCDREGAATAVRDLEQMLDLSMLGSWRPPVLQTSATTGKGIAELWSAIADHRSHQESDGSLVERRHRRLAEEIRRIVAERLFQKARALSAGPEFDQLVAAVEDRSLDPYRAADKILAEVHDT
jgi:LAO/AO transport system kinase